MNFIWLKQLLLRCIGWRASTRTVRYTFSFLFLLVLFVGIAAVITSEPSGVRLVSSTSTILVGEDYTIDIFAEAFEPVNAVRVVVDYDPSLADITVVDRTESVLTLWTRDPYIENGHVYIEGGSYRYGFVGDHKLATLRVRQKVATTTLFKVSEAVFLAGDGSGREIVTRESEILAVSERTATIEAAVEKIDLAKPITLRHISIFMSDWVAGSRKNDFDADGRVSMSDFSILLSRYFDQN